MNEKRLSPKEEAYLDTELAKRGVKAHITYLRRPIDGYFKVVTTATSAYHEPVVLAAAVVSAYLKAYTERRLDIGTVLIDELNRYHIGVALCHHKDNFSRLQGRIIAKGRLLKLTKEENKE